MKKFLKRKLFHLSLKIEAFGKKMYEWCLTEMACDHIPANEFCSDCEVRGCCRKANYYLGKIELKRTIVS